MRLICLGRRDEGERRERGGREEGVGREGGGGEEGEGRGEGRREEGGFGLRYELDWIY